MRRVVVLSGTAETDLEIQARNAAFVQTLPQLGWTDGRNVRIDCHWISSDRRRDRPMIADLEGPFSYSCAPPCGRAMQVTQDPSRTIERMIIASQHRVKNSTNSTAYTRC